MTDPIADMLTRIRNAGAVHKTEVVLPFSKVKLEIAKVLKKAGFLVDCEHIIGETTKENKKTFDTLRLRLRYLEDGRPAITFIARKSKPGSRRYVGKKAIPKVRNGFGSAILSTPKGMMTGVEAKKAGLGGEIICEVY